MLIFQYELLYLFIIFSSFLDRICYFKISVKIQLNYCHCLCFLFYLYEPNLNVFNVLHKRLCPEFFKLRLVQILTEVLFEQKLKLFKCL